MSIFQTAKKVEKKKSTVKTRLIVPVKLDDKIKRLIQVREAIKENEALEVSLLSDIKPMAQEKYLELYKKNKSKPDNFVLQSNGANILIIVQDKYTTVSEEKEAVIRKVYKDHADEIIEKNTEYKFNAELLAKYEKQLSSAIEKIKSIPDEDKALLIEAVETVKIKKGTIDRLVSYENPETLYQLINPVIQIKNHE